MMDRRAVRRVVNSTFRAHGIEYADGGWVLSHPEISWTVSLVVDGSGPTSPHRLVLGASVHELGPTVPTSAEDCYLYLPLSWSNENTLPAALVLPEALFPEWVGTDESRSEAIRSCVDALFEYMKQVDSLEGLRARYEAGDFDGAFIILPLRAHLERRL